MGTMLGSLVQSYTQRTISGNTIRGLSGDGEGGILRWVSVIHVEGIGTMLMSFNIFKVLPGGGLGAMLRSFRRVMMLSTVLIPGTIKTIFCYTYPFSQLKSPTITNNN